MDDDDDDVGSDSGSDCGSDGGGDSEKSKHERGTDNEKDAKETTRWNGAGRFLISKNYKYSKDTF